MLFTWVMIGLFVAFVLGILALGVYSPRSGADVLDWKSSRPAEDPDEEAAQMLAAANAIRRREVFLSARRTTSVTTSRWHGC